MRLPDPHRRLRAIGFDDAPFGRRRGSVVRLLGAVCRDTRFEGMVAGKLRRDGWDATQAIVRTLEHGKFLPQLHLVLLDGIAFGGLNVVDLPELAEALKRPCVTVMRRAPDVSAMRRAIEKLPRAARRLELLSRAGPIHTHQSFHYQVAGAEPAEIGPALARLTDTGHVPEALRLAHLIGSALVTGESGNRA